MADSGPLDGEDEGPERSVISKITHILVPKVVRRNYAVKLALALLIVILLIATIGVVSYVQIQGIIEEDAESTLRSTSEIQSDAISEWIGGMESQTRGIASSDVYGTQNQEVIRNHLHDSQTLAGSTVVGVHYVDPQRNEIVASTDREYENTSVVTTAPAWRDPINRTIAESDAEGTVVSTRAYERNGQLLLTFARSVRIGDGVLVLVADLRQGFEQVHEAETITTTRILDSTGHEVTAPRQSQPMSLANTSAFEDARAGETTIYEHEDDVFAFTPISGTEWVIAAEAPKAELYEASMTVGRNVVFLVASSLGALVIVGIILGRGTVLPLIRLRERIQSLEAGEFDVELQTDREDEIGRLFTAFARMRDSLQTQICETEAARERAERSQRKLERQNERLDQFASTVSHDLRNPLNVADGYRELLKAELTDADDVDPEMLHDHVTQIGESHRRMETIIGDVLALAREGKTIDDPVVVDLETIATEAWENVEHHDGTLKVVETRSLEADRDRLLRVFENLFRNSIEHGTNGQNATRKDTSGVKIEVAPTDDGFYIADDGVGISPDAIDEIFEYGHTTAEDGTGFGLAIVDTIVSAHGWRITVDETYDDGAKFVVSDIDSE